MTDFIDRTADREQAITDTAVANRVRYVGNSAHECDTCGTEIPEGRRRAVPGCKSCVVCADPRGARR